ncbi:MAG: Hpt domain-containing protein [Bacteroidota bacterium]|nr:Hpt domain-containing protein [Bacteroidota bacterium]
MENSEQFHTRELESMAGDDLPFIIKMLETFSFTVPPFIEKMKGASEAKDFTELKHIAHRLKPSFHYLGRPDLNQLLGIIENGGGTQNEADILAGAQNFIHAAYPMMIAVDEHIEKIKQE